MTTGISIHALLAESDRRLLLHVFKQQGISIHALLAESDLIRLQQAVNDMRFLSTLSLRRATATIVRRGRGNEISIHALLAESDRLSRTPTARYS